MRLFRQEGAEVRPVAESQITGESGGEALASVPCGPGKYFVVITEVVGKKGPKEGLSDRYALKVVWRPLTPEDEQEPNDTAETAQPVPPSGKIKGAGRCPADADYYRARLPDAIVSQGGLLNARLKGPAHLLRLTCLVETSRAVDKDPVRAARWFKVVQPGKPVCKAVTVPPGSRAVVIAVSRRPDTLKRCTDAATPEDLLAAYTLSYEIKPAATPRKKLNKK